MLGVQETEAWERLRHFRNALYNDLSLRQDSLFELLDAALTAPHRSTLVRLSLTPFSVGARRLPSRDAATNAPGRSFLNSEPRLRRRCEALETGVGLKGFRPQRRVVGLALAETQGWQGTEAATAQSAGVQRDDEHLFGRRAGCHVTHSSAPSPAWNTRLPRAHDRDWLSLPDGLSARASSCSR
jgi:hypothetical protein